jgi:hypothetical protein
MHVPGLPNTAGSFQTTLYYRALDSRILEMHEAAHKAFPREDLILEVPVGTQAGGWSCCAPHASSGQPIRFEARPSSPLIALSQAANPSFDSA